MLDSLTKKQKIIFFTILCIMISVIIYYIYSTLYANDFSYFYENTNLIDNNLFQNTNNTYIANIEDLSQNTVVVYICGAVKENKVVTLKENSRICDAIEAAGGLTNEADLTNINLAYILEDGEKIYIPNKEENQILNYNSSTISNPSSYTPYSSNSLKSNKININKASQVELETIPGIGPSTALKIINYRKENGKFSSIEDIKNVSGIGDSKYEKIKDYISVK